MVIPDILKITVLGVSLAMLPLTTALGQEITLSAATAETYFQQAEAAANEGEAFWGTNIYGPILLLNPITRQIYANAPGNSGILKPEGNIYTGQYPEDQMIANTSMHWDGTHWAMVILPVPDDIYDRVSLFLHERFHVVQPDLGLPQHNTLCPHLDEKDGRVYLRLELEALRQALASSEEKRGEHISNALILRRFRHSRFPGSAQHENELELNEGLAEFTAEAMCGRDESDKARHFTANIDRFLTVPTFVRSFAYQTIPIYGYLLQPTNPSWHRTVTAETDLSELYIKQFQVSMPANLEAYVAQITAQYNGEAIEIEELDRDVQAKALIEETKQRYLESPVLEIELGRVEISFDPTNIKAVGEYGTLYPVLNIIADWGNLSVTGGALLAPNWSKLLLSAPMNIEGQKASGDGWTLELNEGYEISRRDDQGNRRIFKK